MITGLRPIPFQHYGPAHQLGRAGVGGAITYAVETSRLALIRPGLRPAHLPPPGEGDWQALWGLCRKLP